MNKLIGFFNSMYADASTPSFLLDSAGAIVWHSSSAEGYLDQLQAVSEDIISEIVLSDSPSGRLLCLDDAAYKTIADDGNAYYFVEVFDKSSIMNLYENAYIARHIQEYDSLLRAEIAGVSASCEAIRGFFEATVSEDAEDAGVYLNSVMSACVRLMKMSSLGSVMAAVSSDSSPDDMLISCESFIEELQTGCDKILRLNTSLMTKDMEGACIEADRLLLTSFMLMLIRQMLSGQSNFKGTLEFGSELLAGKVNFIVKASGGDHEGEPAFPDSGLDVFFMGTAAKLLKAEYEVSGEAVIVSLPLSDEKLPDTFKDEKLPLSDGFYSPYNILLNEWSELNHPFG